MPLTRDFKETLQARIESDPAFRDELLREGVECLLAGELETGKAILRDYINATIGFEKLSGLTHKPAKSLMRMLGPKGNPQARKPPGINRTPAENQPRPYGALPETRLILTS